MSGEPVGGIRLAAPEQRNLFGFLLRSEVRSSGPFDEGYVEALKAAFQAAPTGEAAAGGQAAGAEPPGAAAGRRTWLLARIEAQGFGGVNAHGGQTFTLDLDGESLCTEGYNGQGKTSLASVLVCALTGQRLGQHGPSPAACAPAPARDATDQAAPARPWPPAVAYPPGYADLAAAQPRAQLRLTFTDQAGGTAVLETSIAADGVRRRWDGVDPGIPDLLVETAVLMPNRIPHIRVGEETRLVEVLAQLIGLEPLRTLGEHVAALCHGGKNFAGHPKRAEVERAERTAADALDAAVAALAGRPAVPDLATLASRARAGAALAPEIRAAADAVAAERTARFAGISGSVGPGVDLTRAADQHMALQAAGRLDERLQPASIARLPSVVLFGALDRLAASGGADALRAAAAAAEQELRQAEADRERQLADGRLRLKAAAAEWHREHHPNAGAVEDCPLCDRALDDAGLRRLAAEIQDLRADGERVRRTFGEACGSIAAELRRGVGAAGAPQVVPADPKSGFVSELTALLHDDRDLAALLPAAVSEASHAVARHTAGLPDCPHEQTAAAAGRHPEEAQLMAAIAMVRRTAALVGWWGAAKPVLAALRRELFGSAETADPGIFRKALAGLLEVVDAAQPLDDAARHLATAAEEAERASALREERALRGRIVEALTPLKALPAMVEAEARTALEEVSEAAAETFGRIYHPTRLELVGAGIGRKGVLEVHGALGGVHLDAALVANASWLRAFLWSFLFALRRRTLARLGYNPLPLLVLDDPQATFDGTHERQWAALLSEMAAPDAPPEIAAQLFATSYDPKFFDRMATVGYRGRRAVVQGISPDTGRLLLLEDDAPRRAWRRLAANQVPEAAQEYIARVREFAEGQLSLLLHAVGIRVRSATLGELLKRLDARQDLPPISSPPVRTLVRELQGRRDFWDAINASHHHADRASLGVRDAEAVQQHWREIEEHLRAAFDELRRFEVFGPRPAAASAAPPAAIPFRLADAIRPMRFRIQGRVAAATDGRVSLGRHDGGAALQFPNHAAVRLTADTLAPVAAVGDILLVRQHHEPRDGDLVVAALGDRIYARRMRRIADDRDRVALVATSADPASTAPPVVVARSACLMKIVDGVLYGHARAGAGFVPGSEIADVGGEVDLASYAGGMPVVWEVNGDSAVPVALDGQYLLVGAETSAREEVRRLDGRMILAAAESRADEPERYLKRLRWSPPLAILESIDAGGRFQPIVCAVAEGQPWPRLLSAARVNGVIFKASQAR